MNFGKNELKKALKKHGMIKEKMCHMGIVSVIRVIVVIFCSACFISGFFMFGVLNGIFQTAPSISTLDVVPVGYATVIYDSDGNEITKLVTEDSNRSYVNQNQISDELKNAFVAIEDERFYEHNGIDLQGIFRAFSQGVSNDFDFSQGASTITQQLLKNNVFTGWLSEDTFMDKVKRKLQEQYLAVELEKKMDKAQILELYLNTINLGQNTLGVQAASLRYFDKPASQINLSEAAVIAAITQNPTKYNPIKNPENNAERRKKVLDNMLELGFIESDEYNEAMKDPVYDRIKTTNEKTGESKVYTYFVDALTEQVVDDIMKEKGLTEEQANKLLYSGGLKIYSTQNSQIQQICDEIYQNEDNYPGTVQWLLDYRLTIERDGIQTNYSTENFITYMQQFNRGFNGLYYNKDDAYNDIAAYEEAQLLDGGKKVADSIFLTPQPQVSLTVEEQSTGYIVAMIGGRGEKVASRTLNRAANTTRQPGSCFKIVSTYEPAIYTGDFTLASKQLDAPFSYKNGRPVNNWWGSGYKGWLDLRYGIKMSCNIVTVKTLTDITPQVGFDYLEDFGFTTLVDHRETANGGIVSDIGQPMALGGITDGVTNMELNAAYASIANNGSYLSPKLYSYIVDHDGNIFLDWRNREGKQVIHDSTAYLIIDAMKDVVESGTGTACRFDNMAIAGKTGTTSDNKDVWFSGSTPYYTATTWTGFDNNEELTASQSLGLSKSMWKKVMEKIHENLPYKDWEKPDSLVEVNVCSTCGKLRQGGGIVTLADPNVLKSCDGRHAISGDTSTQIQDGENTSDEPKVVCAYTLQTPCAECPFKITTTGTVVAGTCPHNSEFMSSPIANEVMNQQLQQMQQSSEANNDAATDGTNNNAAADGTNNNAATDGTNNNAAADGTNNNAAADGTNNNAATVETNNNNAAESTEQTTQTLTETETQ